MEQRPKSAESGESARPDFYELLIGRPLTEEELDIENNRLKVDDIDKCLADIAAYYPEINYLGGKVQAIKDQWVAVLTDPGGNIVIIYQDDIL